MSCGCKARVNKRFRWTDGVNVIYYDKEMVAKAKVMRKGGTYTIVEAGQQ
jgi:hypothetical protein